MMRETTKSKYRALLTAIWQDYNNGSLSKEHPKLGMCFRVHNLSPFMGSLIDDLKELESAPDKSYFQSFFDRFQEYKKTWNSYGWEKNSKRCPKCNKVKPISEYYKRKGGRLQGWCKDCQKERGRMKNSKTGGYRTERDTLLKEIKDRIKTLRNVYGDKVTFCVEHTIKEEFLHDINTETNNNELWRRSTDWTPRTPLRCTGGGFAGSSRSKILQM